MKLNLREYSSFSIDNSNGRSSVIKPKSQETCFYEFLFLVILSKRAKEQARKNLMAFDVSLNKPNKETVAAILETERIAKDPSTKGYTNLDKLFTDLRK